MGDRVVFLGAGLFNRGAAGSSTEELPIMAVSDAPLRLPPRGRGAPLFFQRLFKGRNPTSGSGQRGFHKFRCALVFSAAFQGSKSDQRVRSMRFSQVLAGRAGLGQEVFEISRVGSGQEYL